MIVADYTTEYIISATKMSWYVIVLIVGTLLVYGGGFLHGKSYGRKKEYKTWSNEFLPVVKKLESERNDLWRSAVSKTHKLNRINRSFRGK